MVKGSVGSGPLSYIYVPVWQILHEPGKKFEEIVKNITKSFGNMKNAPYLCNQERTNTKHYDYN